MPEDNVVEKTYLEIRELDIFACPISEHGLPSDRYNNLMLRVDSQVQVEYREAMVLILRSKSPEPLKSDKIQRAIISTEYAVINGTGLSLNEKMKRIADEIKRHCNDPKIKPKDDLRILEDRIFAAVEGQEPMKQALRKAQQSKKKHKRTKTTA